MSETLEWCGPVGGTSWSGEWNRPCSVDGFDERVKLNMSNSPKIPEMPDQTSGLRVSVQQYLLNLGSGC